MMSSIMQKTQQFLKSLLFYPIFFVLYYSYAIGYRIALTAQDIFTYVYIEQMCGFKRKEKIISAINQFGKVPQDLIIAYRISKFMIQANSSSGDSRSLSSQVEKKILEQHLEILSKVNNLRKITIYIDSQSQFTQQLVNSLENKLINTQMEKQVTIVSPKSIQRQRISLLQVPNKNYTPFFIVFSNYQELCNIPSKYLLNTQISFTPELFSTNHYHLYKAFAQYADSKQRNGK